MQPVCDRAVCGLDPPCPHTSPWLPLFFLNTTVPFSGGLGLALGSTHTLWAPDDRERHLGLLSAFSSSARQCPNCKGIPGEKRSMARIMRMKHN